MNYKLLILFITDGHLGYSWRQMLKAVIFDFGHTIMPETCLEDSPVELMPGVSEAMTQIALPKGIWANTWDATASDIRNWLQTRWP